MANNKWLLSDNTDLLLLLQHAQYNIAVDSVPDKISLPINARSDSFWSDSTLKIPNLPSTPPTGGLAALDVTEIDKPKYFYKFVMAKIFRDTATGMKNGIYAWQGDTIKLLAEYINTSTPGFSVQYFLDNYGLRITALEGTFHGKLASSVNIALDTAITTYPIFTVPVSESVVITGIVARLSSGDSAGYGTISYGSNGVDWLAGVSLTPLGSTVGYLITYHSLSNLIYVPSTTFYIKTSTVDITPDLIVDIDILGYYL